MSSCWHHFESAAPSFRQFVREWRSPDTPFLPVLALHGSLTQSGSWILLAETAANVRMVCPDQRGFGRSDDPGDDRCAAFAADAIALASEYLPQRFAVMGHSFACSIALELARTAPTKVAAAILVDPVVPLGKPAAIASPPRPQSECFSTLEQAERYYRETEEGVWSEPAMRRFVEDVLIQDRTGGPWRFPYSLTRLRRLREFIASTASDHGLLAKTPLIEAPVLVFRGGLSKRFVAAAEAPFAATFPRMPETIICPDSGHFPTATEPLIVAEGIKRFLGRLT